MDSILEQVYSTILPSAPYVIAAYALIWLILFVFVVIVMRGLKKAEKQMSALEEICELGCRSPDDNKKNDKDT